MLSDISTVINISNPLQAAQGLLNMSYPLLKSNKIHENPVNLTIFLLLFDIYYIMTLFIYIHLYSSTFIYIHIYIYYTLLYILMSLFGTHGRPGELLQLHHPAVQLRGLGTRPATTCDDPERQRRCGAPRSEGHGPRGATTWKNGKMGFDMIWLIRLKYVETIYIIYSDLPNPMWWSHMESCWFLQCSNCWSFVSTHWHTKALEQSCRQPNPDSPLQQPPANLASEVSTSYQRRVSMITVQQNLVTS